MKRVWNSLVKAASGNGYRGQFLILTFHRVLDAPDPLMPGEPDWRMFRSMLGWLADACNVIPLDEGVARFRAGELSPASVCLTFDDGYANNVDLAGPLLDEVGMSATTFVAVDAVTQGIMWNDLVIEAFRRSRGHLDVPSLGVDGIHASPEGIETVLRRLKYLEPQERWHRSLEIFESVSSETPPRLMMDVDRLRRASEHGFDVGAHTRSHPILASLTDDKAYEEIEQGKSWLEAQIGSAVSLFAYPNGRKGVDYGPQHVKMVQDAGFTAAVTTNAGCVSRGVGLFELPRFSPWQRRREAFIRQIARTFVEGRLSGWSMRSAG